MKRSNTYFSDVSPLGKIRLSGTGASEFVKVMTTVELQRLATPGRLAPALVLNGEGEVLDLVTIARTDEHEYVLTSNPQTADELTEWLQAHAEIESEGTAVFADVEVENNTDRIATIALYGPEALAILNGLSGPDVDEALDDGDLGIVTIGALQVMVVRWPLLGSQGRGVSSGKEKSAEGEGMVYEIHLPSQASEDLKLILLGFSEIDPESYQEYVARRRRAHTWFEAAEQAAYIKPESAGLQSLLRPGEDFVGAKALREQGLL